MAYKSPSASSSSIILVTDLATSGTVNNLFTIPQDVDGIVAKIWLNSTWSAAGSALIYIQTTEDGGTTWRDVSVTSIGAATIAATVGQQNAHFIPIGCISGSAQGIENYVGSVAASSLSAGTANASAVGAISGLPMLGTLGRIQITYASTITTGGINVQIFAPAGELR